MSRVAAVLFDKASPLKRLPHRAGPHRARLLRAVVLEGDDFEEARFDFVARVRAKEARCCATECAAVQRGEAVAYLEQLPRVHAEFFKAHGQKQRRELRIASDLAAQAHRLLRATRTG